MFIVTIKQKFIIKGFHYILYDIMYVTVRNKLQIVKLVNLTISNFNNLR